MKRPEKIVQLERQLADLKERNRRSEQVLSNRRQRLENAERAKERKRETRRLIIKGRFVEHLLERLSSDPPDCPATSPQFRAWLDAAFDAFVTRADHRALFDLPPLDEAGAPADGRLRRWTSRLGDAAPSWLRFGKESS